MAGPVRVAAVLRRVPHVVQAEEHRVDRGLIHQRADLRPDRVGELHAASNALRDKLDAVEGAAAESVEPAPEPAPEAEPEPAPEDDADTEPSTALG